MADSVNLVHPDPAEPPALTRPDRASTTLADEASPGENPAPASENPGQAEASCPEPEKKSPSSASPDEKANEKSPSSGSEQVIMNVQTLLRDRVPEELREFIGPFARDIEDVCAQVIAILHTYFAQPNTQKSLALIVAKAVEAVELFKGLSSNDKKAIATRCVLELIDESEDHSRSNLTKMAMVPDAIEAVVGLSKGQPLNRQGSGAGVVEVSYVSKKVSDTLTAFIKDNKYTAKDILSGLVHLVKEAMHLVGAYPSLTGVQKKSIVIEVLTNVISTFADEAGHPIDPDTVRVILEVIPPTIDLLASVAAGRFDINSAVSLCGRLLQCAGRLISK